MTKQERGHLVAGVYKETLRDLLHKFGSVYYIDGDGEPRRVKAYHANPERAIAKIKQETNIVLPVITVARDKTITETPRGRSASILVHDVIWDPKRQRAIRLLSLASRPITINYNINIWSKYYEDLDQILESLYLWFNPDLEIETSFNSQVKAFVIEEEDISEVNVGDTIARILRKTVNISVESYIPNPKFMITNTGEVEKLILDFDVSGTFGVDNETLTVEFSGIN
jgi:hypothetical protein